MNDTENESSSKFRAFLWGTLLAVLLATTAYGLYSFFSATTFAALPNTYRTSESYGPAPDFEILSTTGAPISAKSLKGKVWIADFFFTKCGGICPTLTKNMAKVQEAFEDEPGLELVSFSVDSKNDTTEVLTEYAKKYGADVSRWHFLRSDGMKIQELGREGFYLGTTEVPGDILHSDRFVLIDKHGSISGYYHGTDDADVQRIITDAKRLLGN